MRFAIVVGYVAGCFVFGRSFATVGGAVLALAIAATLVLDWSLERQCRRPRHPEAE